jgi:hypothetical protein
VPRPLSKGFVVYSGKKGIMTMTLAWVILMVPVSAAAHNGPSSGGGPGELGTHFAGLIIGLLLFLLFETAVMYGNFRTWFRNPNHPESPSPERFFHGAVYSFVAMVVTGVILTLAFSGADLSHSALIPFYGYNNVCVFFDYPPSTYVCPVYWFFVAYLVGRYAVEDTKRLMQLTNIGHSQKALFYAVNVLLVMSVAFFFVTLSINPANDVYGHTIPFVFMIATLPSVSLMHYFQRESPSHWLTAGVGVYMALTVTKIIFDVYALSSRHHAPPSIGQAVDVLWMIFTLSAPFIMPAPVVSKAPVVSEQLTAALN